MLDNLIILYPFAFYGTVMCLAVAELIAPGRRKGGPVSRRWVTNIGLFALDQIIQRICIPVSVILVADAAARSGHGLLQVIGGPSWMTILSGVLLLDLWKYVEHRLFHGVSLLWRLHLVHHSDIDADFTTSERHHPLTAFVGLAAVIAVIYLCGIPPLSVAIYIVLAAVNALISHANIRLPGPVDRLLRALLVTPAVHTIHHSAARHETDSNFGMLLTVWDRIFGTYRVPMPADDAARVIGLEYFRDARSARLDRVLCQPFLPITERGPAIRVGPEGRRPSVR